jgi:general secretion pathway protein G
MKKLIQEMKEILTQGRRTLSNEKGFTLTEMLIVIALIAMVGTFVTVNVMSKYNKSKADATKIQMKQLGVILDDFRRDCGFYPTMEQGLDALVHKPGGRECKNYDPEGYIKGGKVPKDGFGFEFGYSSDGNKFQIKSLGNDGKEGGEGIDKDITSDELD